MPKGLKNQSRGWVPTSLSWKAQMAEEVFFNELSNSLFNVNKSLKKVAKVFPSKNKMESLEWLMRR
jgi:hypothetical protein